MTFKKNNQKKPTFDKIERKISEIFLNFLKILGNFSSCDQMKMWKNIFWENFPLKLFEKLFNIKILAVYTKSDDKMHLGAWEKRKISENF